MGLINCSECQKEISDKARTCPHCGNPMKESDLSGVAKNLNLVNLRNNQSVRNVLKWVDINYIVLTKSILAICILVFFLSSFYKLSNRDGTMYKASIIRILSDERLEGLDRSIRRVVLNLNDELIMAHTSASLPIRDLGFINKISVNPFIGNFFNVLLMLMIIFVKVRREIFNRWIFVLATMVLFVSISIKGIGSVFNLALTSRYSDWSLSFTAQNRLLFFALILLLLGGYYVFRPAFKNNPETPIAKRIKDWLLKNYMLNLVPAIIFLSYLLLGTFIYAFALIYMLILFHYNKKELTIPQEAN